MSSIIQISTIVNKVVRKQLASFEKNYLVLVYKEKHGKDIRSIYYFPLIVNVKKVLFYPEILQNTKGIIQFIQEAKKSEFLNFAPFSVTYCFVSFTPEVAENSQNNHDYLVTLYTITNQKQKQTLRFFIEEKLNVKGRFLGMLLVKLTFLSLRQCAMHLYKRRMTRCIVLLNHFLMIILAH